MSTKNTLIILLVPVIIGQFSSINSFALADDNDLCLLQNDSSYLYTSDEVNANKPSLQLYNFASTNFKDIAIDYIKNAKPISENILKDSEISSSTSSKILEFKTNLTKFEENYVSCDGYEDLFDLADIYSNATSFYYELNTETLSDDDTKKILNILQKYGSEDLDNEYYNNFDEFSKNFQKKFEDLEEDLKKEESKEGPMVLEWFSKFKNLTFYYDILDSFDEFFKIFEEEEKL